MRSHLDREASERPILVLSNIIVDDLWLADGRHFPSTLGGAATYAAVGAAIWYPRVAIVAGVGRDLDAVTGGKLEAFGLVTAGHLVREAHSIQSKLVYRPDGTRTETPAFGRTHFESLQITPSDIPSTLLPSAATYVLRDVEPAFWSSVTALRDRLGVTLWELQDDAAHPHLWPQIQECLGQVDHFSLNRAEAARLFGGSQFGDAADQILQSGVKSVVLRLGEEGALIATPETWFRVRPPPSPVVDVTGGGNAFCGGFLGALTANGGDLQTAARAAAASAAHALGQYGPANPNERFELMQSWAASTQLYDWDGRMEA